MRSSNVEGRSNRPFSQTRVLSALVIALAALGVTGPAWGQADHLNKQTMIEALGDRDMPELLEHLANTQSFDDPVAKLQLKISSNELQAKNAPTQQQREQGFQDGLKQLKQLIDEFPDRPRRAVWQTDYAEKLLVNLLQTRQSDAAAFYEFGLPSEAQQQAYEQRVPEAYRMLAAAKQKLFEQQRLLGQGQQNNNQLSGALQNRLFNQLNKKRLPYYLAHAAYFTALLPNDHPYFQNLGQGSLGNQAANPKTERQRLLQVAIGAARPLADGNVNIASSARRGAMAVAGRAMSEAGQQSRALQMLNRTIDQQGLPRDGLLAVLGKARTQFRQGNAEQAYGTIDQAQQHELVQKNLRYRVLLADLHHRLLKAQANQKQGQQRQKLMAKAFEPYQAVIEQGGDQAQNLKNFIFKRIYDSVASDADLSSLSPMARLAVARMSRIEGQQAKQAGNQQQAKNKLDRAIDAGKTFENASGVSAAVRAEGLFNKAIAAYHLASNNRQTILSVGQQLIDVARLAKDQPIAMQALGPGMSLLRRIHQLPDAQASEKAAYQQAVQFVFDNFPLSEVAVNERLYYGSAVLEPNGQFLEAAEVYSKVPEQHPDYFKNQRRRVMALAQHLDQLTSEGGSGIEQARQRLRQAAQQVENKAQPVAGNSNDRAQTAKGALAAVTLGRVELALSDDNTSKALDLLADFQSEYGNAGNLLAEAQQRQLLLLVEAGRLNQAAEVAKEIAERFPQQGAAVIDQTLDQIQTQIRTQLTAAANEPRASRRREIEQAARQKAQTGAKLAQLLFNYAKNDRGLQGDQLLPYELSLIESLRMAGQVGEAKRRIEKLKNQHPNNGSVLSEYADVLFAQGTQGEPNEQLLTQAAQQYNKLIQGTQSGSDLYWNAWMRRLQINDRLGKYTNSIPRRVSQLKERDKNLGGDPYRSTLQRLADKYRAGG
jgi:hypothetical protein